MHQNQRINADDFCFVPLSKTSSKIGFSVLKMFGSNYGGAVTIIWKVKLMESKEIHRMLERFHGFPRSSK